MRWCHPQAAEHPGLLFGQAWPRALGDLCVHGINLPPRLLGLGLGGHLDPVGLQGQVDHCHGYVLSPEAEAQPPMVAVPQQGPGSDGNGGPLPAVTIQPVLEGNQVVEQVLLDTLMMSRVRRCCSSTLPAK